MICLPHGQAPILPEAEAQHLVTIDNFPNITRAREAVIEVVLQPGDALYAAPALLPRPFRNLRGS